MIGHLPKCASISMALMLLAACAFACDRGTGSDASSAEGRSIQGSADDDSAPAVIDADWVASKLQAPPPPDAKDWLREIEKDPIAALENMDPGSLQPRKVRAPAQAADLREPQASRGKTNAKHDPNRPLRDWPPTVGQFYPNLVLKDQTGQVTAISDFRGKVVLVEVVGLTCRACHAFAGGNKANVGRFRGIEPQRGLDSIEKYARGYARLSLDHPDIVFVQLVLYGLDGRSPPSEEDARAWAVHFDMNRNRNQVVLIGDQRFIGPETRRLIPGFHLIDQNGILRAMSSNDPRHDRLHDSLLPKLAALVNGR